MSLSCFYDDAEAEWYYMPPDDFTPFSLPRRKRCSSCHTLITHGALSLKFDCFRYPKNDIEERIYGNGGEISMAPKFLCEPCGDQYFNLTELGFCIDITGNVIDQLKEYVEEYGRPMK